MRIAAATLALLLTAPLDAQQLPVAQALADRSRPAADTARDSTRKPSEILAFAGIKPGQVVGDYIMGGGYFTRLFAAVVGPTGKVYAYQADEFIRFRPAYGEEQKQAVAGRANVVAVNGPVTAPAFPAGALDVILTSQNYHDLHLAGAFPPGTAVKAGAALFAALKPGGTLVVIDHVAPAGVVDQPMNGTHRIDPAAVRAELEQVGFNFDGETAILREPADPLTANVFDPAIRGKTDQFVYRFRKPA